MRDLRLENALFWPHMRNTSYEAFFEQMSEQKLPVWADVATQAGSMWLIERETMSHPILDLEEWVAHVLAVMESTGVFIDNTILQKLEKELTETIKKIETDIAESTGETTINLASPLQLQKLLFEVMKIKPIRKTKTGWSVDEETLTLLAEENEICKQILIHRHASKLLGTYVKWLAKHIDHESGRVHTAYDSLGASTGRMSSDSPNLQNIPAGDPWSDEIKSAFRPENPDWSYVVADYSQIEIRILACLSGDDVMLDVFRHDRDLHTETARFILWKEDITSAERKLAKTVNFGVMYGITPFGLSKMIEKTPAECGEFINAFFTLYPRTREYFDHVVSETKRIGYAETFFGRRRAIKWLSDNNSMAREQAKREAMNMPIQWTCADIIKYAIVKIAASFKEKKLEARLLMTVHDEIVVECPDTEIEIVEDTMKNIMEHIVTWEIVMSVEIGSGKTWRSAK